MTLVLFPLADELGAVLIETDARPMPHVVDPTTLVQFVTMLFRTDTRLAGGGHLVEVIFHHLEHTNPLFPVVMLRKSTLRILQPIRLLSQLSVILVILNRDFLNTNVIIELS